MAGAFAPADSTASSAIRVFPLRVDWIVRHAIGSVKVTTYRDGLHLSRPQNLFPSQCYDRIHSGGAPSRQVGRQKSDHYQHRRDPAKCRRVGGWNLIKQ